MTCHDARESLSADLDEALVPDERQEVAAHLEACPDCRRELARLEQTVALLHRVEPPRAPVGFVDRVTRAARPAPWYRRAAAAVFLPFSIKLPAEATALVMVALLAVYVFERTPALQESARQQPAVQQEQAARERVAQPGPASERSGRVEPSGTRGDALSRDLQKGRDAIEAQSGAPSAPARQFDAIPAPAPAAPRSEPAPAAAPPAATAPAAPSPSAKVEGRAEERQADNRQPSAEQGGPAGGAAPAAPRLAAKRAAPSTDVVAGIAVRDREAVERDLAELIVRVGGRETGRRREEEATVVEAVVPQARYAEFTQGLARLGAWRVEAERPDPPAQVHVILRLQ
ncbi:MAG TPA: zf-HC2 domain-containing protein [Methylomirabilota bacterium]|nr:zf-HC2 domain-containing protein [Methylomirabilota bacterium]